MVEIGAPVVGDQGVSFDSDRGSFAAVIRSGIRTNHRLCMSCLRYLRRPGGTSSSCRELQDRLTITQFGCHTSHYIDDITLAGVRHADPPRFDLPSFRSGSHRACLSLRFRVQLIFRKARELAVFVLLFGKGVAQDVFGFVHPEVAGP